MVPYVGNLYTCTYGDNFVEFMFSSLSVSNECSKQ